MDKVTFLKPFAPSTENGVYTVLLVRLSSEVKINKCKKTINKSNLPSILKVIEFILRYQEESKCLSTAALAFINPGGFIIINDSCISKMQSEVKFESMYN